MLQSLAAREGLREISDMESDEDKPIARQVNKNGDWAEVTNKRRRRNRSPSPDNTDEE